MAVSTWLILVGALLQHLTATQAKGSINTMLREKERTTADNGTSSETVASVGYEDDSPSGETSCILLLKDKDYVNTTLMNFIANNSHLLRYNITIIGEFGNKLTWKDEDEVIYKPYLWTRIGTAHGKVLLALVFNYETVSLRLLSFGVMDLNITMEAHGCRSEPEIAESLRRLVHADFYLHGNDLGYGEICHQVVLAARSGFAGFAQKCYRTNEAGELEGFLVENAWIQKLHILLQVVRVFVIMFGPLLFQTWVYEGDLQSSVPYVVHLHQKADDSGGTPLAEAGGRQSGFGGVIGLGSKLLAPVLGNLWEKVSVCEIDVPSSTKSMHIVVDHTKLMSQSTIPVNVFSFIMEQVIGCGFMKSLWMGTCSAAGCLCGTWPKSMRSEEFPPARPTWGQVCKLFNAIIVGLILVPLPFHIRIGVYWYTEAQEMSDRETVAEQLAVGRPYYEALWLGICWPTVVYIIYATYVSTLAVYVLAQGWVYHQLDDIIQDCMFDLKDNCYLSIISMMLYHVVVPFRKFGFLVGILFALPYYVVVLPIAACIAVFYGVPTVYMIGRLFFNLRMNFLDKPISCCGRGIRADSMTDISQPDGEKDNMAISDIFALNRISRDSRLYRRPPAHRIRKRFRKLFSSRRSEVVLSLFISTSMVLLMLSCVLMYAEALRYFLHMLLLALAGLVLNAKYTMDFFILLFWTALYCVRSIQSVHSKYIQMSKNLFGFFKDHLKEEVADATRVPEQLQTFTAFKYFDSDRLQEIHEKMQLYTNSDDDVEALDIKDKLVKNKKFGTVEWDVHALVLFVDKYDLARIPRKLFWRICDQLKAPGCPGPLARSIGDALKQLLYMMLFLFIIYAIIMSFHEVFDPGSNNQLLVTVASGFLPLIIRHLIPRSPSVDLSEYSLKGKIEEILLGYREQWPLEEETTHSSKAAGKRKQSTELANSNTNDLEAGLQMLTLADDNDEVIAIQRFITKEPLLTFGWSWKERTTGERVSIRHKSIRKTDTDISIVVDSTPSV